MQIDWPTLINWIVSGGIGLIFGLIGAWVAHKYQVIRDDTAWKREREKLKEQFEQEKQLLELQYQQRLDEQKMKLIQEENDRLKKRLVEGIDNPQEAIRSLSVSQQVLRGTKAYWHLRSTSDDLRERGMRLRDAMEEVRAVTFVVRRLIEGVKFNPEMKDELDNHLNSWQNYSNQFSDFIGYVAEELFSTARFIEETNSDQANQKSEE